VNFPRQNACRYSSGPEQAPAGVRMAKVRWLVGVLALAVISAGGCGGCGGGPGGSAVTAKWGGMSKEEWLKKYKNKDDEDKKKKADKQKAPEPKIAAQKALEEKAAAKPTAEQKANKQAASRSALDDRLEKRMRKSRGDYTKEPDDRLKQLTTLSPSEGANPGAAAASDAGPTSGEQAGGFADWKDHDYYIARVMLDPALIPAVAFLGSRDTEKEAAAELLTRLLQPWLLEGVAQTMVDDPSSRGSKESAIALNRAIITALGANGTAPARDTLKKILAAQFKTEDDFVAVETALQTMGDHLSPEHEAILLRVLTSAEVIRPPGHGVVDAETMRFMAVEILKPKASRDIRTQVAQHMVKPKTPQGVRNALLPLVREINPLSLEAQAILYQDIHTEAAVRKEFEAHFVRYSSDALGWLLDLQDRQRVGQTDPDWGHRVGHNLWNPRIQMLLDGEMTELLSMSGPPDSVLLACTIPTDSARSMLYRALQRYWREGPQALETGLFELRRRQEGPKYRRTSKTWRYRQRKTQELGPLDGALVPDVGFLVTLKMLYRAQEQSGIQDVDFLDWDNATGQVQEQIRKVREKRLNEMGKNQEAWNGLVDRLRREWCNRFYEIWREKATAARLTGSPLDPRYLLEGMPLELLQKSNVVAAHHVSWPSEFPQSRAYPETPVAPLEVYYARLHEKTSPKNVLGIFRRRLPSHRAWVFDDGFCIDGLDPGIDSDSKQSIDIRVTPVHPDVETLFAEERELVIEILAIKVRDPSLPAK